MGKLSSLICKVKKTLADYSLRRFLFYAAQPMNWPLLLEMRQQMTREIASFQEQLESVIGEATDENIEARHVFRPWLICPPSTCLMTNVSEPINLPIEPELRMRIDRLGWVLEQTICDLELTWGSVESWLNSREIATDVCNDAYSRSERIANLVMLWSIVDPPEEMVERVKQLIQRDAECLLKQIEYHGELNTNNHVLNNARALLISGIFLGEGHLYRSGCFVFEHQLYQHVGEDGLLREASSHYQLVVTRWLLEIACVFSLQDQVLFKRFLPVFKQSLMICQSMFSLDSKHGHMALIGDISPDFPPDFYRGLPSLGNRLFAVEKRQKTRKTIETSFWQKFFGSSDISSTGDWLAENGSWAKFDFKGWNLLLHADTAVTEPRVTHGHHDLFSFDLSYNGLPLIVDPGRCNYSLARDSQDAGILEEWHNTLMLEGVRTGFQPRGYMPASWLRSFRNCPTVVCDSGGLHVSLRNKLPHGVTLIERSFNHEPDGSIRIQSTLTSSVDQQHTMLLVLHLAGEVKVASNTARITHGDAHFFLNWENLPEPTVREAKRYVAYEQADTCLRLEWCVPIEEYHWQSEFVINKEQISR